MAPTIPIIDYSRTNGDRAGFLRDMHHALADIGFMVLTNTQLTPEFQRRTFSEVRRFFTAPADVKATAGIDRTPYFRGHSTPVQNASQLVETYQYGMENAPLCAHDDASVPSWKRIFYGPNTWPAEGLLPGFRPAVEELRSRYLQLSRDLGHLICESLGVNPVKYDELFDPNDVRLAAFLSHGYSLAHVEKGGIATNRQAVVGGKEGRSRMEAELRKKKSAGSHVDVTPFITLLTMDSPGLQVLANNDEWVDMPVIPGAVCVNVGSTLQHLSEGKMVATIHRVNTALIPEGQTRVSLPFFLLPKFDGDLGTFFRPPGGGGEGKEWATSIRGDMAAYNRMTLFRPCTRKWWAAEFDRLKEGAKQAEIEANKVARRKVVARGQAAKL